MGFRLRQTKCFIYETKDKADAIAEEKNKLDKMYTTYYSDIEKVEDGNFEK